MARMTFDMSLHESGPIKKKRHSWYWRGVIFHSALLSSISKTFNNDALERYKASIDLDFQQDISGQDVILVACDEAYFWRYAVSFIQSLSMIKDRFYVHLHLIRPNRDVLDQIERLRNELPTVILSVSADPLTGLTLPRRVNIYYNSARFVVADQLLDQGVARLLILDVDTIAKTSPWRKIGNLKSEGAFSFRPHTRKPWHKILANAVYYGNSDAVRRFSRRFSTTLLAVLAKNPSYHIDQIIPHYLLKIGARQFGQVFGDIPADLISLDYNPKASLWTAKGSDKSSSKFLHEKSKVDAAFSSDVT